MLDRDQAPCLQTIEVTPTKTEEMPPWTVDAIVLQSKAQIFDELRTARDVIKKGWTKGAYARSRSGHEVASNEPGAEKFCMLGALHHVGAGPRSHHVISKIVGENYARSIPSFNDGDQTTLGDVVDVFDKAIESL